MGRRYSVAVLIENRHCGRQPRGAALAGWMVRDSQGVTDFDRFSLGPGPPRLAGSLPVCAQRASQSWLGRSFPRKIVLQARQRLAHSGEDKRILPEVEGRIAAVE